MREEIIDYINKADDLQSLPETSLLLMQVLFDEDAGVRDVVEVLKQDPALTTKMLKIANSARFGGVSEITSLELAASRLGMRNIRQFATVSSFSSAFHNAGPWFQRIWNHSVFTAFVAEYLISTRPNLVQGLRQIELFTAALLHSVSCLLIAQDYAKPLGEIFLKGEGLFADDFEEKFGLTVHELSEILFDKWNLQGGAREAIAWANDEESSAMLELIRLAKYLCLDLEGAEFCPKARMTCPRLYNEEIQNSFDEYMQEYYESIGQEMELIL